MNGRISRADARRLIYGLSLASVVVYINLYLVQGMLPMLAEHFAISPGASTLILSVSSFSLAFSLLGYALISDAFGRFRPLIISLWLLALTNPLMLVVDSWSQMLALRLLQGVLLAAVPAIAMAYLRDKLPLPALIKAGAFYIAANSFGGILGRLLGGFMAQHLSWFASVVLLSGITLVAVAISHRFLAPLSDATRKPINDALKAGSGERRPWKGFILHLGNPALRVFYIIGGLAFMVMVNQFSFIQLHLLEPPFGWSRFEVTLIFLCYLSGTLSAYRSGSAIKHLGVAGLLGVSLVLMVAGSVLTLLNTQVAIILGFLLSACGFFLIHACCNSQVALRATGHRAKASSLYLCCYYLGASLGGPFLMPFWHQAGWAGVVFGSLIVLGATAAFAWFALRRGKGAMPLPACR